LASRTGAGSMRYRIVVKYITAMPRMQLYMDYSAKIYGIYLRYVSKEDIHVYSVDECFIDVTNYLQLYHLTAKEMAVKLMQAVMEETGITATAGVGTNLYLAKIAMDIVAKHVDDHIGILDEFSYREQLWDHKPLSDFWRIGSADRKKTGRLRDPYDGRYRNGFFKIRRLAV